MTVSSTAEVVALIRTEAVALALKPPPEVVALTAPENTPAKAPLMITRAPEAVRLTGSLA